MRQRLPMPPRIPGARARPRRPGAAIVFCAAALLAAVPAGAGAGGAAPHARLHSERAEQRLLAGHLLRRIGFGPDRREMHEVLRVGRAAYLERQLHPDGIDDRRFHPEPGAGDDGDAWQLRWLTRMAYSRRQLQEKMALLWHEHVATSYGKVGSYALMRDQERFFRANAPGSFRDLLIGITTDNAMLSFLDNTYNNGRATDADGNPIPPDENYTRELLQLFGLGVNRLNMDGSVVFGEDGRPLPAYTEADVKEVARALTGWIAQYPEDNDPEDPTQPIAPAEFADWAHYPGAKTVLGAVIPADAVSGARDVERVVDIIMAQPTTAPFISKQLIQKLATETPSPAYVERVATVFAATGGDIRAVVRAIVGEAEFTAAAAVRSQLLRPADDLASGCSGLQWRRASRPLPG